MTSRARIDHLISLAAPFWAGEAEVVRTYWTSPKRTVQTDMLWLARQCFKEFWSRGASKHDRGGIVLGTIKFLGEHGPKVDVSYDRHEMLDALEGLRAEFSHYVAFADVYDAIRPAGTPALHPDMLESWPEEDKLAALRAKHMDEQGALGVRASKCTEGGYCALFREGKAMKGRKGTDGMIAEACTLVYEDEFEHMLAGIVGVGREESLSDADWRQLEAMMVEQLKHRILMRNGQFSHPLSEDRLQAIFRGDIKPLPFDYERAGLAA